MKVVSEELSAPLATMTIENSKELYLELGLFRAIGLYSWLLKVEHNRNPVLVVIPDEAIVCVCTVSNHIWVERLLRYLSFLDDWPIRELDHHFRFLVNNLLLLSHGNWWKHALRCIFRSQLSAQWLIQCFVELVFLCAW